MREFLMHKDCSARVEFDADDRIFFGRIAGIADGVGFHADTVDGLIAAFEEAVDDHLATCVRVGKRPDRPYSGKLMLRNKPELHRALALRAALAGKSLNQFGAEALAAAV